MGLLPPSTTFLAGFIVGSTVLLVLAVAAYFAGAAWPDRFPAWKRLARAYILVELALVIAASALATAEAVFSAGGN